ncbi:hypothetical protein [Desulfolucanica intricata]|uniref:hypothetical protein n=1 Tax=Desulfolucanica intricata TaxID=1285191 RepID=UPI0008329700|nr:hypothetical protein [Desulfolucanica intricata]
MPHSGTAQLPLEILIKGSISDLIKETCSITALPDAPELDSTIKDKRNTNNISKQEIENSIQRDKNNKFWGLLNELKLLYFRRISVRTQQSVYVEGILAEVGRDFIILITSQLSVVTIPLSGIVSFNILNP